VLAPLGYHGVPALLLICVAFMAAFYGSYAFVGDGLRTSTGASAGVAGLVVLTYGLGFGLASGVDRWLDRLGAERVLPWLLLVIGLVYLILVPATRALWSTAGVTLLWGFVNHLALNALILLLSRARPDRRGSVLGLNSAVTYFGALVGTGGAGLLYAQGGFIAVGPAAAAVVTVAGLVALRRPVGGVASQAAGEHASHA
jgi:predicted MFS family arabinose efflux permease